MKAQAFDTFKLMIAAVVAVAILGILMSILGGITVPGADPTNIIRDQLAKAYQYKGSTFVSTSQAQFQAGVEYSGESFADVVGGVGTNIEFYCEPVLCNANGDTTVTIENNFKAKIKTKCDATTDTCYIGIGDVTLP